MLLSRCTDELSEVQPSRAELYEKWGFTPEESKKPARAIHYNAMQPWSVAPDGSVHDAMYTA